MISLFRLFLDIAVWRRGPQDLPGSPTLFSLCAIAYLGVSFVQARILRFPFASAGLLAALDLVFLAGVIALILSIRNKRERWLQTMAALLGVGTLIGLLDLAVSVAILSADSTGASIVWFLAKLAVILLIVGRILQHALDTRFLVGISLAYAILLIESFLVLLVPERTPVTGG